MARPLFEQYKDALRRGHVALLGDEPEVALEAYREAASLVPDRPLPYASIAGVLERLGRPEEALAAYDRALALGPDDAAVADARAALLARHPDGGGSATSAPDVGQLERLTSEAPTPQPRVAAADSTGAESPGAESPLAETPGTERAGTTVEPEGPVTESPGASVGGAWPAIDLPSAPAPAIVGPPPDPAVLEAEAQARIDAGDPPGARDLLLTAVAVHRAAGRLDAALDACLQLLSIAPGDPRVHLAIANLQLDRGWDPVATEKIELLLRLTALSGDAQAEADVHLLAAERLRDESPTRLDARRRGLPAG